MKITCQVIQDLLPLYAEDMVSEDSRALVDDHLCTCDGCTKLLGELKKKDPIPLEGEPGSLKNVKKMIVRRRALSVMASVFTLLTVGAFVISFLFAPFQLTKDQALDGFYVREDGAVVIDYSSAVVGRMLSGREENWYLLQYSTRYDVWKGQNRKSLEETFGTDGTVTEEERLRYENIDIHPGHWEKPGGGYHTDSPDFVPEGEGWTFVPASEKNWWYSDPAGLGNDTLLHDAGEEWEARGEFGPVYPLIFFGGSVAALVLLMLQKILKQPFVKELLCRLAIVLGSVAVSTFFVSSGRIFTSTVGVIDQYWGWMIGNNTVFLTLTVLFWRQLYLLNKQDKAE